MPASASSPARPLTTAAVCRSARVTRGMLRLYERDGLIEPPRRTDSGYRDYPGDTVARLQAVKQLKEVGFTLKEIALLLSERDNGDIDPAALQRLAGSQLAEIDARIARLRIVRDYVDAVASGNAALIDDPECSFLLRFLAASEKQGLPAAVPAGSRKRS